MYDRIKALSAKLAECDDPAEAQLIATELQAAVRDHIENLRKKLREMTADLPPPPAPHTKTLRKK